MKKSFCILLAALFTVGLAACATSTAATTPPVVSTALPAVVTFADPVLEAMVRGAMGKPEGDITATEAEAVTRLNLSLELERYVSEEAQIKEISGLENFKNLESLDLSFHALTDVSPLAGLTKLATLSLAGNPVADITPLAGLTNLKGLTLSNCAAQDYSPLAKLVNLEFLMLDNSTITDVSPLASLTNLKHLYLDNSTVDDYSPLANIYPNLKEKDFTMAFTLKELGFSMNYDNKQATYDSDSASITINHSAWGAPPAEWDKDIIRISMYLESGYKMAVGFYGDLDAYVFLMDKEGQPPLNYVYDTASGNFTFGEGDRESSEQTIRAAMDVVEGEDVLLAPISIFNDTIRNTFSMTADALYAMPFEPPSLKSFGFFADEANAVYLYEYRGEKDVNIEVHRPEWGEKEYDVRFFTPLSDEYRIVVTYTVADRKFVVGADDNDQGGAAFDYFIDTNEHVDIWCSNKDMTVEEYFINAYNDPEIEDIYFHSVELMQQYFSDTFGMTIEELFALPTGE